MDLKEEVSKDVEVVKTSKPTISEKLKLLLTDEKLKSLLNMDEIQAGLHYDKKREQSLKYYAKNPSKCKQYSKKKDKTEKAEPRPVLTVEERKTKQREYAREKYKQTKEQSAIRQKAYRQKRREAHMRLKAKAEAIFAGPIETAHERLALLTASESNEETSEPTSRKRSNTLDESDLSGSESVSSEVSVISEKIEIKSETVEKKKKVRLA